MQVESQEGGGESLEGFYKCFMNAGACGVYRGDEHQGLFQPRRGRTEISGAAPRWC